jgi:hypothetical protein
MRCCRRRAPLSFRYQHASGRWEKAMSWQPELEAAPDPAAGRAEIEDRLDRLRSSFRTPRHSGSRRLSIRATPAASCAIWPATPSRCAPPAPAPSRCGLRPMLFNLDNKR